MDCQNIYANRDFQEVQTLEFIRLLTIPVLIYSLESLIWTKADETLLTTFKREIMWKIYDVGQEDKVWRRRYNFDFYNLCKSSGNIIRYDKKVYQQGEPLTSYQ